MSPTFLYHAVSMLGLIAMIGVALMPGREYRMARLMLMLSLLAFQMTAVTSLRDYATGRARYEKLDNPDSTRTWQRIEVTK